MTDKRLNLIIVSDDNDFFHWIASTIRVSNLIIETISQVAVASISDIQVMTNSEQLLIIEDKTYSQHFTKISHTFSSIDHELPLLIVTEAYNNSMSKINAFAIIDTIVKPSLSIHSLEHAICSLLKDYKLTQRLKKLAHYDSLTGAANRYLFDDRMSETLKKAKREKQGFSLLFFDLNGFKSVNDNHGHEVGDLLLKHFVSQLNKVRRETDTLARLGGDEFCMLLPNTNKSSLLKLVDRIKGALSVPLIDLGLELHIQSAIGGVNIQNQSISLLSPKEILKIADKCVYEAKKTPETHLVLETI